MYVKTKKKTNPNILALNSVQEFAHTSKINLLTFFSMNLCMPLCSLKTDAQKAI